VIASGTFVGGDIWQNVWHVEWDSAVSPISAAAAELVADQFEDFYTDIAPFLWSAGTALRNVSVQDMNAVGLIPWEFAYNVTGPAVDTIPQILACCLTLRNNTSGLPSHRGRIFLPMTGSDALAANGTVIAASMQGIVDSAATLATNLTTNTDSHGIVILSRKFSYATPCTQVSADNYAAVVRGRQNAVLKTKVVSAVDFTTPW